MGLVTAEGGRVINTSGNVIHFTGIAWAGQAGRPIAEAQPRRTRSPTSRAPAWPSRARSGSAHGGFPDAVLHVPRGPRLLAARAARRRARRDRAGGARRSRLRVRQGAGEVAATWSATGSSMIVRLYPAALLRARCCRCCWRPSSRCCRSPSPADGVAQKLRADAQWLRALPRLLARAARAARAARDQRRRVRALADAEAVLAVSSVPSRGSRRCSGALRGLLGARRGC